MSIEQVLTIGQYSFFPHSRIKEDTKRKLQALGIDLRTVVSEAHAQLLIKEAFNRQTVVESKEIVPNEKELSAEERINMVYNAMTMNAEMNKYLLGLNK